MSPLKRCREGEGLQDSIHENEGYAQGLPVLSGGRYAVLWRILQYFHQVRDNVNFFPLENHKPVEIWKLGKKCLGVVSVDFEFINQSFLLFFFRYSESAATMEHSCSCCKETRSSTRTVDLHCLNGDVVPYTYIHVENCGCDPTDCTRAAGQRARRRRSFTLV